MSFLFRSLPLSAKGQWLEPDAARTPERAVGQLPTEGEARLLHQGARRDGGELRRRVEHVEKKFHPVIFFAFDRVQSGKPCNTKLGRFYKHDRLLHHKVYCLPTYP